MRVMLLALVTTTLFAQTVRRGDYVFTVSPASDGVSQQLVVMKGDKVVWDIVDYRVRVLDADSLGMPRDLTGDKLPDAVVETFSGGAHCCVTQYVLSLGYNFEESGVIDHPGKWTDRDDDGLWEISAGDLTFDYWKLPHSDSPLPAVVLEASRTGFHAVPELMRTREPGASDVLAMLRESRDGQAWKDYDVLPEGEFMPPSQAALHRHLVELIYTGHAKLGLELLDTGWPPFIHGKEKYLADLRSQLQKSPYWSALAELNRGTMFGE